MGDRANIAVQDNGKRVFFYTHWKGRNVPAIVAAALERGKGRHNDPSYLARIVFCELVTGEEHGETGFGISTTIGDNEYPLTVIDCDTQTVRFEEIDDMYAARDAVGKQFTFAQFIALQFDGNPWQTVVTA